MGVRGWRPYLFAYLRGWRHEGKLFGETNRHRLCLPRQRVLAQGPTIVLRSFVDNSKVEIMSAKQADSSCTISKPTNGQNKP
jgi:hypothetical protein